MQSCYDGYLDTFTLQNLFGHVCRRGVRNGIVDVEEIKLFVLYNTHHFTGQGKFVRSIFKQRIRPQVHFVIKKIFIKEIKTGGLGVSDEMNFMSLFRERFSEFGRYNTATPESRVTNNSNFYLIHRPGFIFSNKGTSS